MVELPDDLLEMAFKYHTLRKKDVLDGGATDELYRSMVSGFGELDTNRAIQQMGNVSNLIDPSDITTFKWYQGMAIKNVKGLHVITYPSQ